MWAGDMYFFRGKLMKAFVALRTTLLTLAAAIVLAPAAQADFNEDQQTCNQITGAPDGRLAACTRQIESGKWEGHNLGVSYNNRGIAYRDKGEPDRAIADYNKTIELDAKYQLAWYNRGNAYADKKDFDHAIPEYTQAIALDPTYAFAYFARAAAYQNKKDYDHAIADYSKAIELNPKYAAAYDNRASVYQAKGDLDRALSDYSQLIAFAPSISAYNDRGSVYKAKADFDRAIADYSKAIEINPKVVALYNNRALAYRYKGDFAAATADYTQALQLDPKNWSAIFSRGHLAVLTGAMPAALADLNQAADMMPKNIYPALWLEIANTRGKVNSRLADAAKQLDMTVWPAPVVRLYLGQLTPEALFAAADNPDAGVHAARMCEANFYAGEFLLQQGKKDDAARLFKPVAAGCQKDLIHYESARTELKVLGAL